MKTFPTAALAAALLLPLPASAQHAGHASSTPAQTPPPATPGAPASPPQDAPSDPADPTQMDQTQMDQTQMDQTQMDQTQMDHAQMDHAQMDHTQMDHAQMDHAQEPHADHAGTAPRTPIPVLTGADRAAARRPARDHAVHDNGVFSKVVINRLEGFDASHGTGLEWEGQAWVGTDRNKLWLRSEGERVAGRTDAADLEVLHGRPLGPWWELLAGVRHDFKPGAAQDWAAIGVAGLAPYKIEVEATAYVGAAGRVAARVEAEYELLLTNRLVLQPLVEANFHGKADPGRGVGAGLSTLEAGLRLRYEVHRRFAPYVGLVHERAFGATAGFRRASGETARDTRVVAGVRVWF